MCVPCFSAGGPQLSANAFATQIEAFHSGYATAVTTASELDAKVLADSAKISPNYADVVALSIRQFAAATEFTVSRGSDGAFNTSDLLAFQKVCISQFQSQNSDLVL